MYEIRITTKFKKDIKMAKKRGQDLSLLSRVVGIIQKGEVLPPKYRDHTLSGNWQGYRECHITPDWLLIYLIENDKLILTLVRTGSHSDLFDM